LTKDKCQCSNNKQQDTTAKNEQVALDKVHHVSGDHIWTTEKNRCSVAVAIDECADLGDTLMILGGFRGAIVKKL
jgi:hypothetical protein